MTHASTSDDRFFVHQMMMAIDGICCCLLCHQGWRSNV